MAYGLYGRVEQFSCQYLGGNDHNNHHINPVMKIKAENQYDARKHHLVSNGYFK